jgi:hypothetical protein
MRPIEQTWEVRRPPTVNIRTTNLNKDGLARPALLQE